MTVRSYIEYVVRANLMERRRRTLSTIQFAGPELIDPPAEEMADIAEQVTSATDRILRAVREGLS